MVARGLFNRRRTSVVAACLDPRPNGRIDPPIRRYLAHLNIPGPAAVVYLTERGRDDVLDPVVKANPASRATPCEPSRAPQGKQGCPKIGLHTLRHSAAAVMLVNGVPLKVVSEVLGHASIGITGDIYGHVAPDVSRDALARLSVALG